MCGILIIINKNLKPLNVERCKKSLNFMYRRGPDWSVHKMISPNVFMGQVVLSMTGQIKKDLTQHYSNSKNKFILFNGEIYNFKDLAKNYLNLNANDKTTDTKVLVNLFEKFKINYANHLLDGMYSFVIYDKLKNSLMLNRDPQGEKSLYIYEDSEKIIISSEINTIINYNKNGEINFDVLKNYFYTRHFIQFDKTIFKNIKILEPGNLFSLDLKNFKFKLINKISFNDYINPKKYESNLKKSEDDLIAELDFLLNDNIKEMIPDRKFASIVSGGVDSSLISNYICKVSNPTQLIALDHVGKDTLSNTIKVFEKKLNYEIYNHKVYLNEYYENYLKALQICNSPIHSHSFVGQLIISKEISRNGCRALFGGEGADELFGGYDTYRQRLKNSSKNNSNYTKIINKNFFKKNQEFQNFKNKLDLKWKKALSSYKFIKNKGHRNRLAMMLMDSTIQLTSEGLRRSDLMSMFYSVESRSIFLRKEIVKFALNLPINHKIDLKKENFMNTKILLKKVFSKYFSKKLISKKQGFAGFPNETKRFLDKKLAYNVHKFMPIKNFDKMSKAEDRAIEWKLINVEMYLEKIVKKDKYLKSNFT